MKKELICIICPRGCSLKAEINGENINVSGHSCLKGEEYAVAECIHPMRTVTSSVRINNREDMMVSVKTAVPIPKENIFDLMEVIRKTEIAAPVKCGQVIIENLYGTDIIATKTVI